MKVIKYGNQEMFAFNRDEIALILSSTSDTASEAAERFNALLHSADKELHAMYKTKRKLIVVEEKSE